MKPRGRPCTACRSSQRAELDAALATGEGNRTIARRFALGRETIRVHRGHLSQALVRHADVLAAVLTVKAVGSALDKIAVLEGACEARRVRLAGTDDDRGFLAAIQTEAGLAKMRHELTPATTTGNAVQAGKVLNDDELTARLREVMESLEEGGDQPAPDAQSAKGD